MTPYPAIFDVSPPARSDRLQLVLRLVICAALGVVGVEGGALVLLLYLALPAAAAVVVQSRGADIYLSRTGPAIVRLLRWLLSFEAYMLFLTDRFPTGAETLVRYEVRPAGVPTPGGALLRLLTSLPEAIVLLLLGIVSGLVAFLGALTVLAAEKVPAPLLGFQRGLVRWQARLLAYHASLVDAPPPYALEGGSEDPVLV